MFISELVIEEAGRGNPDSAARRLEAVKNIPLLKVTDCAVRLAKKMIAATLLPVNATDDALHISLAAEHKMDYLLTWNCRHIDNAEIKPAVRSFLISEGFMCPEICTPQELMGGET